MLSLAERLKLVEEMMEKAKRIMRQGALMEEGTEEPL